MSLLSHLICVFMKCTYMPSVLSLMVVPETEVPSAIYWCCHWCCSTARTAQWWSLSCSYSLSKGLTWNFPCVWSAYILSTQKSEKAEIMWSIEKKQFGICCTSTEVTLGKRLSEGNKKHAVEQGMVVRACNHSTPGGWGRKFTSSRPTWAV